MLLLLFAGNASDPPDPEPTERVGGAGGLVGKPPRKSTRISKTATEPDQWGDTPLAAMMRIAIAFIASGALEEFD